MPKEFHRAQRLGEQIHRELSQLVRDELRDPRLGPLVTLTGVEVSRDLAHAKVFFSSLDKDSDPAETGAALRGASGFLRGRLAREIQVRVVPRLNFVYDDSIERGAQMDELIDQAVARDEALHRDQD